MIIIINFLKILLFKKGVLFLRQKMSDYKSFSNVKLTKWLLNQPKQTLNPNINAKKHFKNRHIKHR
jgi:hypothetical protein